MAIASEHERIGGFCRIVYKPGGPSRLRATLKLCVHALKIVSQSRGPSPVGRRVSDDSFSHLSIAPRERERLPPGSQVPRRNSEKSASHPHAYPTRPSMTPRSMTANPGGTSWHVLSSTLETHERTRQKSPEPDIAIPTIAIGTGGTLLKSSIGTIDTTARQFRVLVVEDNNILRHLL